MLKEEILKLLEGYVHDSGCYEYSSANVSPEEIAEETNDLVDQLLQVIHQRIKERFKDYELGDEHICPDVLFRFLDEELGKDSKESR